MISYFEQHQDYRFYVVLVIHLLLCVFLQVTIDSSCFLWLIVTFWPASLCVAALITLLLLWTIVSVRRFDQFACVESFRSRTLPSFWAIAWVADQRLWQDLLTGGFRHWLYLWVDWQKLGSQGCFLQFKWTNQILWLLFVACWIWEFVGYYPRFRKPELT